MWGPLSSKSATCQDGPDVSHGFAVDVQELLKKSDTLDAWAAMVVMRIILACMFFVGSC